MISSPKRALILFTQIFKRHLIAFNTRDYCINFQYMVSRGKLLNWIKSFLTNRRQRVLLNGSPSDWEAVVSGVPQGTIMGPIFFLLFVNDVPNTLYCKVMLFADDAKLYSTINEEQDCINLQADLDSQL